MFVITAYNGNGDRVWYVELFSGVAAMAEVAEMKVHRPDWIVELKNPDGKII